MASKSTMAVLPSEFLEYSIEEKLEFLRKISRDVTYNNDLRSQTLSNHFHSIILRDLPKHNNQTYTRLFFMFFHNSIPFESKDQLSLFHDIFISNTSLLSGLILNDYREDPKIQKFLLGIIYKLFICNSIISKEHLNTNNLIDLFIQFSSILPSHLEVEEMNKDNDLIEINDWLNIIFQNLLNNDNEVTLFNTFLMVLLKSDNTLFLELVKDVIDNAKQSKVLLISMKNISFLIELFISQLNFLHASIASEESKSSYEDYMKYDNDIGIAQANRKFLCLVDIFSVILTTEDLNNEEYTKIIQSKVRSDDVYRQLISLMQSTDDVYDKVFIRNKAVKGNESKAVPKLSQTSILFCFQTNLMKILSNFAYGNEHMKLFFISNPGDFYYLLNHMKIDQCNPFKKEWCVLLIKSLCEKSAAIQAMIADLKPMEMDPLLKDYIINKGTHLQMGPNSQKELNFDLLTKN